MKKRLQNTMKKYAALLCIGLAYFIWVFFTGWSIPCVIHLLTGYQCPACGITRMMVALLSGQFLEAYSYNPFLFFNLPIILFCIGYADWYYVKTGKRITNKLSVVLWLEVFFLVVFGIVRNIIGI